MRFLTGLFLLFSLQVSAQPSFADSSFARRLADTVLLNSKAYANLRVLTKQIGNRLAGSAAQVKAEEWGFKTLQQADADTVFYQSCMVPVWRRDLKAGVQLLEPGKAALKLNALDLGNTVGTGGKPVTAGVVRVTSWTDLQAKAAQIKGKIVFYDVPFEEEIVETFNSYGRNAGYRTGGPSRAAALGAVGVVVRSMTHDRLTNHPHTGTVGYNDSFPKIHAMALGLQSVETLRSALARNPGLQLSMQSDSRLLADVPGRNVVAEIKGTDSGFITVGGHLDSWDVGEGAHDDGAGVVQTIEVLRALKAVGYRPFYTLRFVLFANEENGGRGGKAYAAAAKAAGERHVFALESDAGGFTPRGFAISATPAQIAGFRQFASLMTPYLGDRITEGGGGSDIGPLRATQGTATAGLRPDSQRYFDLHHTVADVLEAVHPRELSLGALNMALLIYLADTKITW